MKRIPIALPLVAAILLWPLWAFSQQTQTAQPAPGAHPGHKHEEGGKAERQKAMAKHHEEMKAECERAMAAIKAMDARLDEKVAAMNASAGDQKVSAMEAVINELVAQRKEMRDKMTAMHHSGMGMPHPWKHGKEGMKKGGCPMMEEQHTGAGSAGTRPKSGQ